MAKVLLSAAGANAVTGSKIARADVCSDVGGSKRMTLPWDVPGASISMCRGFAGARDELTKSYTSIPQPGRNTNMLTGGEAGELMCGEKVPDNGNFSSIVADHQSSWTSLAGIVDRYQQYIVPVLIECLVDGQGVVVKGQYDVALRIKEVGGGRSARLEGACKLMAKKVVGSCKASLGDSRSL